ncbi:MAG: hypothetical protein IJW45_08510 [Oscillospiraceae bacterium]|nr:hypothetical protein [Oscillospiraceae bacterium]
MARYVNEVQLRCEPLEGFNKVRAYLEGEGFEYVTYKGENVFQKGIGFWTAPTFIKVTFGTTSARVEAWIKYALLPGVFLGEMGMNGAVGFAAKGTMKRCVPVIEQMLSSGPQGVQTGAYVSGGAVQEELPRTQAAVPVAQQSPYDPPVQGQYGVPTQSPYNTPVQGQYGVPTQSPYNTPVQGQYGVPTQAPYGAPVQGQYGVPTQSPYNAPVQGQYGVPAAYGVVTVCPVCGAQVMPGSKYCDYCGGEVQAGGPVAAPAMMPQGMGHVSKAEYRKLYAPQSFQKSIMVIAIIGYIFVGINLLLMLAGMVDLLGFIDLAICLGCLLGMHIGKSKGCAIGLLVYGICNMLILLAIGQFGGWIWVALGIAAVLNFNNVDKEYDRIMAGYRYY